MQLCFEKTFIFKSIFPCPCRILLFKLRMLYQKEFHLIVDYEAAFADRLMKTNLVCARKK